MAIYPIIIDFTAYRACSIHDVRVASEFACTVTMRSSNGRESP